MYNLALPFAEGANEGGHGCAVTHSQTTGLNSFSSHVLLDVKFTSLAGSPGVCVGLCMSYCG